MGASVSSFAGGASMIAWLFAQLPQIVKNYQQGSVESLAPTFLLSWMAGDATNLLGCILTDQLVFQTYLATYFCCIDVILIAQYVHYSRVNPGPELPEEPKYSSSRFLRRHLPFTSSSDMSPADPMSQSFLSTTGARSQSRIRYGNAERGPQTKHKSSHSRSSSRPPAYNEHSMLNSVASLTSVDDSPEMTSSVISLPRGRARSGPRGSRDIQSQSRGATSPSRQRSMIFLGLFAFIGFGSQFQSTSLSANPLTSPTSAWDVSLSSSPDPSLYTPTQLPSTVISFAAQQFHNKPDDSPPNAHTPEDVQRIIGRSSAWICAALYLTSRMPQVWKNYRRRSVEGLSILLFMAAFVGNLTYTVSILTNPFTKTDPNFLVDALPYLIGSGGTLIFDLTIMSQSLVYRNQHPRLAHSHSKKRSRSRMHSADEEGGLMDSETDDEDRGREPRKDARRRSHSIPQAIEVEEGSGSLTISPTSRERNRSIGRSLDMYNAEARVLEAGPLDEAVEPRSVH